MTVSRTVSGTRGSVARDILKRRDRKKKLPLSANSSKAPEGWTFVPYGTPELSDRCKELSRLKGISFSIVNVRNTARAMDPGKLSHHVHRAGYHFKTEIVEQACEETGHQLSRNVFVKTTDLAEELQKSYLAQVMAKHGFRMEDYDGEAGISEQTRRQVSGAIRELFPNIPEFDVDKIVTHAWKKGSDRVGTHTEMPLYRRVQLAVVACIRHLYTDYDRLLRAFGWEYARAESEQDTLRKLIEWRGDGGQDEGGQDEELVEIVRKAMLDGYEIDDHFGSAWDGEDTDATDTSDASIEVIQQRTIGHDIGAESVEEFERTTFPRSQRLPSVRDEQHSKLARDMIESARQRIRNAASSQAADVQQVSVQMDEQGLPPTAIIVDGKRYERAAPVNGAQPSMPASSRTQPAGANGDRYHPHGQQSTMQSYYDPHANRPSEIRHPENVRASIEPYMPVTARATSFQQYHVDDRRESGVEQHFPPGRLYSQEPYDPRQPMVQPAQVEPQTYQQPYGTYTSTGQLAHPQGMYATTPQNYQQSSGAHATIGQPAHPQAVYGTPMTHPTYSTQYVSTSQQQTPATLQDLVSRNPHLRYVQAPQPIHGAPAPVQQVPYEVRYRQPTSTFPAYQAIQPPPMNGAPHPARYFQQH